MRALDDAQGGGALGGWLLELRAAHGDFGCSRAASIGPSSVTGASSLMLRAMRECVAVISVDASTNRVRPRSASMLEESVTIAGLIEREIATRAPFLALIEGGLAAPRQCAPLARAIVSR
jgi:hypothetical protein